MSVVALHGFVHGLATPEMLERDMGHPSWVDYYLPRGSLDQMVRHCVALSADVLVGYSRGGYLACKIAELVTIRTLVLYECPLWDARPIVQDAVVIYNDYRKSAKREAEMGRVLQYFSAHMTEMQGKIPSHVQRVPYWPFLGHSWDQQLNPRIEAAISVRSHHACLDAISRHGPAD